MYVFVIHALSLFPGWWCWSFSPLTGSVFSGRLVLSFLSYLEFGFGYFLVISKFFGWSVLGVIHSLLYALHIFIILPMLLGKAVLRVTAYCFTSKKYHSLLFSANLNPYWIRLYALVSFLFTLLCKGVKVLRNINLNWWKRANCGVFWKFLSVALPFLTTLVR